MEIKKVRKTKEGTKLVVVPKKSDIVAGDYVAITKIEEPEQEVTT